MIDETFRVGILLISCIPSMLSWQCLQCEAITDTLNVSRRSDSWWNNVGQKVIDNMIRHVCKTNVQVCKAEMVQEYKGIRADNSYNVKISEG